MNIEQNKSAHAILNNYHPEAVEAIKRVIETAHDLDEFKIVSDLLRGTVEHLLAESTQPVGVERK